MWMCACRVHLYGDVYSSPGLDMKQKQLLMVAFLGQANMLEEMSGHALAVSTLPSHLQAGHSCIFSQQDVNAVM
jgi:alkylhydroperoxidase/carboxymuconolactone decarboxylase family protein YurZ